MSASKAALQGIARFALPVLVAVASAIAPSVANASSTPLSGSAEGAPPVGHVWVIMLENHSFPENFGPPAQEFQPRAGSPESMTYLAKTLPSQGALLDDYFGVAHPSNSNYTALVSGQPPSFGHFSSSACPKTGLPKLGVTFCTGTLLDCLYYTPFEQTRTTETGVAVGQGCVYPSGVPDVGTQMRDATPALSVKAYEEDMERPCQHPPLGAYDEGDAGGQPGYETGGNPFLYFSNWIEKPAECEANDVPLNRNTFEPLVKDLQSVATTPNLSWIGPNLCDQGHDLCPNFYADRGSSKFFEGAEVCPGAQPTSEHCDAQTSAWLNMLIPKITASPAYKENGLIAIVWDEANFYSSSPYVDSRACCNEPNEPGATGEPGVVGEVGIPHVASIKITPGTNRLLLGGPDDFETIFAALKLLFEHPGEAFAWQPGGGDSGAVLLSPFIKGGTVSTTPYDQYSTLRTLQSIFGLPHTGNAADPLVGTFGSEIFNNVTSPVALTPVTAAPGGGLLSLDPRRGTTVQLVGDGVVVHARCRASGRRTCRGVATLSVSVRGRGAPATLGSRSYVQPSDRPRDLTIYLSKPALRYLHAHRHANVRVTFASRVAKRKTTRVRRALTVLTPR